MSDAVQYCDMAGQTMNAISKLEIREAGVDIEAFDISHGDRDLPDPLMSAHRLAGILLQCGGDIVYGMGQLLELEEPMVISPAVLARSAAEYASKVWYLSDPQSDPSKRVIRMARLFDAGLKEVGVLKPTATAEQRELFDRLQRWSKRQNLGTVPTPHKDQLIADMADEQAQQEYNWLSGYVHASAVTITLAHASAVDGHSHRPTEAWFHVFYATDLGLSAAAQLCKLWQGDVTAYRETIEMRQHCLDQFNAALMQPPT